MRGPVRVFRKPSLQQQDRLPVSTYEEAVNRLVVLRYDETLDDFGYDAAVRLVADIFWKHDKAVRRDVMAANRQIGGS